jgi:general stress protein 26
MGSSPNEVVMKNTYTNAELEVRLWDELKMSHFGMLGLATPNLAQNFQPMTAFADPNDNSLWFFTRDDTDLVTDLDGVGSDAVFILQTKDQTLQACLNGRLSMRRDEARIDQFWNPVVAAWYPDGKKDSHLALLRFEPREAAVWLSETGHLKFAWEILKANATKTTPNIGEQASLNLRR